MADYTDASRLNQIYDFKEEIRQTRITLRKARNTFPLNEEKILELEQHIDWKKAEIIEIKAEMWKSLDALPTSKISFSTSFNRRGRVLPRKAR